MGSGDILAAFIIYGPPLAFLGMAWSALRGGRYAREESLATVVGTWCWILSGVGGFIALSAIADGVPIWRYPLAGPALGAPIAAGYYARVIWRRARALAEQEALAAAAPGDALR